MQPRGKDRLIVALDVPTAREAIEIAAEVGDHAGLFKVGLELLVAGEWRAVIEALPGRGFFVDLKLPGDIPETITRVVRVARDLGVRFITLSESVRAPTVAAARAAREGAAEPRLLAVTLVSSVDAEAFERAWGRPASEMDAFIVERSGAMLEAGCDGLIASGPQIALVRREFPGALIVSPGIRPAGADTQDHRRVTTPTEALEMGADYLVVGRPITRAADRRGAARAIARELEAYDARATT